MQGLGRLWHADRLSDISKYTKARTAASKQTPLILLLNRPGLGAADAERDVRGFAIKFYTGEGSWDLVGSNTPVFFVATHKFPDFIHTQKRHRRPTCGRRRQVGFLVAVAGRFSGDDPVLGSRPADDVRHINGYGSHLRTISRTTSATGWFTSRRCRS